MKYKSSLGPINRLRATNISTALQQLIEELLDTDKLNTDTISRLSKTDTTLLETLLDVTKTRQHFNYRPHVKSVQDHVDRFNLLQSAVGAGNQSAEIRAELVELLRLLSSPLVNRIPKHVADEMIELFSGD